MNVLRAGQVARLVNLLNEMAEECTEQTDRNEGMSAYVLFDALTVIGLALGQLLKDGLNDQGIDLAVKYLTTSMQTGVRIRESRDG